MKTFCAIILIPVFQLAFFVLICRASVLPPPPTGYLRQPAVVHPVLGFMPISWSPDTNAALYEVWSAPELCGPWTLIIRTQGTNASVTNHLAQEFFQVVSVTADGFNSLGNYQ